MEFKLGKNPIAENVPCPNFNAHNEFNNKISECIDLNCQNIPPADSSRMIGVTAVENIPHCYENTFRHTHKPVYTLTHSLINRMHVVCICFFFKSMFCFTLTNPNSLNDVQNIQFQAVCQLSKFILCDIRVDKLHYVTFHAIRTIFHSFFFGFLFFFSFVVFAVILLFAHFLPIKYDIVCAHCNYQR